MTKHPFPLLALGLDRLVPAGMVAMLFLAAALLVAREFHPSKVAVVASPLTTDCEVRGTLEVNFAPDMIGRLELNAQALRGSDQQLSLIGNGSLADTAHAYTIDRLTDLNCSLIANEKDGSQPRTVIHLEAIGTLATAFDQAAGIPLILNLRRAEDGSYLIDNFVALWKEGDWFGSELPATGTFLVNPR